MNNKYVGRLGLSTAIQYYTLKGYTVSIPLNDTQWYDLIVGKDQQFKTIQCKCTKTKENSIALYSCGGTNGKNFDNVRNYPIDILFCVDNCGNVFEIPLVDIKNFGNKNTIRLNLKPSKNNQGFPTYKYFKGNFYMGE